MKPLVILTNLLLLILGAGAQACPVCGPGPGQQASDAASNAILFLLAVILLVMGGIISFVITLANRSRKVARQNQILDILSLNSQQHP
jgi:uncharacterized protein involved in response to NO